MAPENATLDQPQAETTDQAQTTSPDTTQAAPISLPSPAPEQKPAFDPTQPYEGIPTTTAAAVPSASAKKPPFNPDLPIDGMDVPAAATAPAQAAAKSQPDTGILDKIDNVTSNITNYAMPGMGFLRHAAKTIQDYAGKKAEDLEASRVASANKGEKSSPALNAALDAAQFTLGSIRDAGGFIANPFTSPVAGDAEKLAEKVEDNPGTGIGSVRMGLKATKEFAEKKAEELQKARIEAEDSGHKLTPAQNEIVNAAYTSLKNVADTADAAHGFISPSGLAIAAAAPAAPILTGAAFVAHGLYGAGNTWGDVVAPQKEGQDLSVLDRTNPDALRSELMSGAEVFGGAAGVKEGVQQGHLEPMSAGARSVKDWMSEKMGVKSTGPASLTQRLDYFKKAIPQSKAAPYEDADLVAAEPYLREQHAVEDASTPKGIYTASDNAVEGLEHRVAGMIDKAPAGTTIKTNPIAEVSAELQKHPKIGFYNAGMKELENYKIGFERSGADIEKGEVDPPNTLKRMDDLRHTLNQENAGFLKANNMDIYTATQTNPAFAARYALADSLRNGIYDQLEGLGIQSEGVDARSLRKDEGSLLKIKRAALRQEFNGEKLVSGTGTPKTITRKAVAAGTRVAGSIAGAGIGSIFGPVGTAVGASTGRGITEGLARSIEGGENLSRNTLLDKFLNPEKPEPVKAPKTPEATQPTTQSQTPVEEKGGNFAGAVNQGATAAKSPEWLKQNFEYENNRLQMVLRNPESTVEEKAIAQSQLNNIRDLSEKSPEQRMVEQAGGVYKGTFNNGMVETFLPKEMYEKLDYDPFLRKSISVTIPKEKLTPVGIQEEFLRKFKEYGGKEEDLPKTVVKIASKVKTPKSAPKLNAAEAETEPVKSKEKAVGAGAGAGVVATPGLLAGGSQALSQKSAEESENEPQDLDLSDGMEAKEQDIPSLLSKASKDYGVPEDLLYAQAMQESRLNPNAESNKGAKGVMQLMDQTSKSLGVTDPKDPAQNVDGGARLMAQLHTRFGSWDKALAAYNWRPEKVQEAIDKHGDKWLDHTPDETKHYVKAIMAQQK